MIFVDLKWKAALHMVLYGIMSPNFLKGCLSQILLGPFLNALSHILRDTAPYSMFSLVSVQRKIFGPYPGLIQLEQQLQQLTNYVVGWILIRFVLFVNSLFSFYYQNVSIKSFYVIKYGSELYILLGSFKVSSVVFVPDFNLLIWLLISFVFTQLSLGICKISCIQTFCNNFIMSSENQCQTSRSANVLH